MGRRSITIRQSLLRNLILLIALTAGAILVTTWIAGTHAVDKLSKARIDIRSGQTEAELERFFGAVRDYVLVSRGWAQAGLLDATDHEAMNRLFVPLLERAPYLSSLMVADTDGAEYLLLRDPLSPHIWTNRVVQADAWGRKVLNRRWNTETGEVEEAFGELDYDPRRRVWFQGAMATRGPDEVDWTEPVIFFVTKDPGITAGTHAPGTGSRPTQVLAFDLLLMDISRFTTGLPVSENGKAFVLVEDPEDGAMRVVGLPRSERFTSDAAIREALVFVPPDEAVADTEAELPPATELGLQPLPALMSAWTTRGHVPTTLEFESGGERWWAGLRPFPIGRNTFWIGVAVPERDFLGDLVAQGLRIVLIALLAIVGAICMAFWMARRYARPLESLARASHRIRELDLEQDEPTESALAEIGELADAQGQMVSALRSFARYVPADVVGELVRRGEVAQIGGRPIDLTILFTDIEGFTSISEGLSARALTNHMAEYFEAMIVTLQDHGATVDKFVGDAIVAFWGAPRSQEDHARRAARAVLACRARLEALNRDWVAAGRPALPTRFGLATGEVVVGNIGARSRLAYTVLGDTVNLASRLEHLNKAYGTYLLGEETLREAAGPGFAWRRLDRIRVVGRTEPVFVYELLGLDEDVPAEVREAARAYEAAWDRYAAGAFGEALERLDQLVARGDASGAVARLRTLCRRYQAEPPEAGWDAVTVMLTK